MKDKTRAKFSTILPYLLSVMILILVILIIHTITNKATEELTTYKTEGPVDIFFYLQDVKFEYSSKITISNENEVMRLTTEDYQHDFDSEPIYYKDKREVLFPNEMNVIHTRMNYIQNRISKFTKVTNDNDFFKLINKNLDYVTEGGVLYDGDDLYFFLNYTTIKFDNQEIKIKPYSYVTFNFNKELHIYDYETDKMTIINNVTTDVLAISKDYTINLGIDAIIYKDETKLLMKNFDYLKLLENQKY